MRLLGRGTYTRFHVNNAAMSTVTAQDIVFKAVRLAGLKAVGITMSNDSNMSKNCLCAAAIAARIMDHFDVKYKLVLGYTHIPGVEQSFPHVWLETPGGFITDLTFSGPYRKVVVLNCAVGFHDDATRAEYTLEPKYSVDWTKSVPLAVLQEQVSDIAGYVQRAPARVKTAIQDALLKGLDGSDKLEITGVSADVLASVQPASQGSS